MLQESRFLYRYMKQRIIIFIILLFGTMAGKYNVLCAQSPDFSIFDSFEKYPRSGEGKVVIHQPESVKKLVGTRIDSENIDNTNGITYIKTQGYRVQVYSGNNQRVSRDEAISLQEKIKELYHPDIIATYVEYNAPFWKLHVGNYRSFEEASQMLRDLRIKFPKTKNEIYIVEVEILLQLD